MARGSAGIYKFEDQDKFLAMMRLQKNIFALIPRVRPPIPDPPAETPGCWLCVSVLCIAQIPDRS